MIHRHYLVPLPAILLAFLLITGCATQDVQQFEPRPRAEVGATELEPVDARPVVELVREAEDAFHAANAAQEEGDRPAALRHYTHMLELLIQADLDPAIFYSLRGEFEAVLDTSTQQASLFQQRRRHQLTNRDYNDLETMGDIQIPFPLPERVLTEIEEIQNRYPKNFQQGLDRSKKYAPYIRREFAKAGLPEELMWIAMVESLFTPKIVSRAGAGGMWQFMKATGQRYNLRIDRHVDERYNWQSATKAAIAYLRDLYAFFDGDWALAVTAYNMGEGGLERAIAANGGERHLWTLLAEPPASNRIRTETKKYYARFLAQMIVASNPERYGFKDNDIAPEKIERVPVSGMYALAELNRVMGLPSGALEGLNPDLLRNVTPPDGDYSVAVPAGQRKQLLAALDKVKSVEYAGGNHVVRRGETVSSIAARYKVDQRDLMALNGVTSPRRLRINQKLRIPGGGEDTPAQARGGAPDSAATASAEAPTQVASANTYRIRRGDTLYEIAAKHNTTVAKLQAWNRMGRNARIRVGRSLYVNDPSAAAQAPAGHSYHEVRAGEYPARIAKMHGLELKALLAMNDLSEDSTIRVGDKLLIGKGDPASVYSEKPITHTVSSGDTASTIAAKYGVPTGELLTWNELGGRSTLHIGDKLVVYTGTGSASPAPDDNTGQGGGLEKIIHKVARGHNPTTIARRYGVSVSNLFRWNNWPRNKVLQVGDEVIVYQEK
ncbi:MAG: LysM peptidoglycan-binding domain-containing protein [Candidatus Hydrogenedentota bacterium]